MILECMLYIFIFTGIVMGFLRGWKQELFALASIIISFFASVYLYIPLKNLVNNTIGIENIYNIRLVKSICSIFSISLNTFSFIFVGVSVFVIVFVILSILFNSLFFPKNKLMNKILKKKNDNDKNNDQAQLFAFGNSNRFLGGLVGILTGLFLGLFLIIPISTLSSGFTFDGFVTSIILNLPVIGDVMKQILNSFIV